MTDLTPTVLAYPKCNRCGDAFVLRRAHSFTTGKVVWTWMRDCKCRGKIDPVVVKEKG